MTRCDLNQLPEVSAWGKNLVPAPLWTTYVKNVITLGAALAVSELVLPTFVEREGRYFREAAFQASSSVIEEWDADSESLERLVNHLSLWDAWNIDQFDLAPEIQQDLAERMLLGWRSSASNQFPEVPFEVELYEEYGPTLTIYVKRP